MTAVLQPGAARRALILIVDDDPVIRFVATQKLSADGFDVIEAENGEQAIELFKARRPDLILLDVEMPGMDGFAVCEAIRSTEPGRHVPILMATGRNDVAAIERAYQLGATDFDSKPLDWIVMVQRIRYILRASESFLEVRQQQVRMDEVQRYARLGSWEIDLETGLLRASSTLRSMVDFGDDSELMEAEKLACLVHEDDRDVLRSLFAEAVHDGTGFALEHRVLGSEGAERVMHTQARIRRREGEGSLFVEGFSQDITERRRTEDQVRFLSYSDGLTGLSNRNGLHRQLEGAIQRASRTGRSLAMLAIDLDQFKRVNDTFGLAAGDALLQYAAGELASCIETCEVIGRDAEGEPQATLARPGGDEFMILVEGLPTPSDAGQVARSLLDTLSQPVSIGQSELHLTASIGIAVWPHDGEDGDTLLANADRAMYHAKEIGRANYQFYREQLNADALERFEQETQLRHAIEHDELVVLYQPKLELASGRITGCEALVRWPNAGNVQRAPDEFIPMAEASGLIDQLGRQVLHRACRTALSWQERGWRDVRLAVNLSPQQLKDDRILETVDSVLAETGFDPSMLELEITESALIHNEGPAKIVLDELRRRRIRTSLDDFGTGFSSLSYLKRFPVQSLKIDRSFITGIGTNSEDEAITAAILSMAKDLGLKVVAEGIETDAQLRFLEERHCDEVQGFLISPPLDAEDFARFLESHA